jgi:oligosaccharide repeat unit polymerase
VLEILALVILAALPFYFTIKKNIPISFYQLISFFVIVQAIAVYRNGLEDSNFWPFWVYFWSIFVFLFSMSVVIRHVEYAGQLYSAKSPKEDTYVMGGILAAIFFAVLYHYGVSGVPLFSESIVIDRFDNNSSGLFGLPGRVSKYGPLILIFLLIAYKQLMVGERAVSRVLRWALFLAVISLVFSGFKSALLIFLECLLIGAGAATVRPRLRENFKIIVLGIISLVFVFALAIVYGAGNSSIEAVFDRIFLVSGAPFYYLVTNYIPEQGLGGGEYLVQDIRYLGQLVGFNSELYSFQQHVSASIHGKTLGEHFIVPTTLTAIGYFYSDFGFLGAVVFMAIAGWVSGRIFNKARGCKRIINRALFMYAQLVIFICVTRGNVVYEAADKLVSLAFFGVWVFPFLIFVMLLMKRPSIFSYVKV